MTKLPFLLLATLLASVASRGQGTVNFVNIYPNSANPIVNAPVYEADGATKCTGTQFVAELLGGPNASNLVSVATTGFGTGFAAGYFNGGLQRINSVPPGWTAWVQVDVWNTASGPTFQLAQASGLPNSWWQSSVFPIMLGGAGVPPTPATILTGLGTSPVFLNGAVPEPSPLALCILAGMLATVRFWRVGTKI